MVLSNSEEQVRSFHLELIEEGFNSLCIEDIWINIVRQYSHAVFMHRNRRMSRIPFGKLQIRYNILSVIKLLQRVPYTYLFKC